MAVTLTVEQLKSRLIVTAVAKSVAGIYAPGQFTDADYQGKLDAAKAMVERFGPGAPEAVQNEACLRTVAYLIDRSPALTTRDADSVTLDQAPGQISALRHSGAMALLSPWKVRRAGAI